MSVRFARVAVCVALHVALHVAVHVAVRVSLCVAVCAEVYAVVCCRKYYWEGVLGTEYTGNRI
jgi:hypothetical protein